MCVAISINVCGLRGAEFLCEDAGDDDRKRYSRLVRLVLVTCMPPPAHRVRGPRFRCQIRKLASWSFPPTRRDRFRLR